MVSTEFKIRLLSCLLSIRLLQPLCARGMMSSSVFMKYFIFRLWWRCVTKLWIGGFNHTTLWICEGLTNHRLLALLAYLMLISCAYVPFNAIQTNHSDIRTCAANENVVQISAGGRRLSTWDFVVQCCVIYCCDAASRDCESCCFCICIAVQLSS